MEDQKQAAYKNMLIDMADLIDQNLTVLETMKFRCDKFIKGREREQIKSAIHLWTALEKREFLGPSNTSFLKDILKTCTRGQREALNLVENYERLYGNTPGRLSNQQATHYQSNQANNPQVIYLQGQNALTRDEQKILGPDLKREIAYLTKSLGRNWTFCMRELGVPENEIEMIKYDYRHMKEQIHQSLLMWQNIQKQDATKERLVYALRAVQRNDLANTLEEGVY